MLRTTLTLLFILLVSVSSFPIAAWYGCRVSGNRGSDSSIRQTSQSRGERAGPVRSTAAAQPDFTRKPSAAGGGFIWFEMSQEPSLSIPGQVKISIAEAF